MTPVAFRALILASLALMLLASLVDVLFPALVPPAFATAMRDDSPLPGWLLGVSIVWSLAFLAANVGLCVFKRWARPLALAATLASYALACFITGGFASGVAAMFESAAASASGAALALAYFSPLAARFASAPAPASTDS